MKINLERSLRRFRNLYYMSYTPRWIIFCIDVFLVSVSLFLAYLVRYDLSVSLMDIDKFLKAGSIVVAIRILTFLIFKPYAGIVRFTNAEDAVRIFYTITSGTVLVVLANIFTKMYCGAFFMPFSIIVIDFIGLICVMTLFRIFVKLTMAQYQANSNNAQNVLIYGTDKAAIMTKHALDNSKSPYKILSFFDTANKKSGKNLEGIKIKNISKLESILKKEEVDKLIIAKVKIKPEIKHTVVDLCLKYDVEILTIPKFESWVEGQLSVRQMKKVKIEDLLEREPIKLDEKGIHNEIGGKTVLVTGCAGSIGSEIVRQLTKHNPKEILLFDSAETPMYQIEMILKEEFAFFDYQVVMGDVRDIERVEEVFSQYRPQIVYHAAALKHVPMVEENPREGVKTNVVGTINVAEMANKYEAEKFVMVSTDKAVNPTNVMGATKRLAEIYTQSLNAVSKTSFITTRFGNVLGSNGSVIPRFKKQIEEGGPVTVTHPQITRFFMTIPEACQLVLQAGTLGKGGEIFVFDMGESVKIIDLAKKMIKLSGFKLGKEINISITGLRPGEKLYEEVLNVKENTLPTQHSRILVAKVREYEFKNVKNNYLVFKEITKENDNFEIVRNIKRIVPEFKSKNSKYDVLDREFEKE